MSILTIVGAILAVGFIILVHEAGHYFVARWCKMKVERFSIGFGPALLSKSKGDSTQTFEPADTASIRIVEPPGGIVSVDGREESVPALLEFANEDGHHEVTVRDREGRSWTKKVEVRASTETVVKVGYTDFTIGPIPFGGFVQIHGMLVSEEADPNDVHSFPNRPVWQRFLTIFAGPATNYVAAFVLAIVYFNMEGVPLDTARYVVGDVAEDFDAMGKLEPGDIIQSVNGDVLFRFRNGKLPEKGFVARVQEAGDKPLELVIIRDGKARQVSVLAKPNPAFEGVRDKPPEERPNIPEFRIGILLDTETGDVGFVSAVGHAAAYPFVTTKELVVSLYELATQKEKRKDATLMGPVGITDIVKKRIDLGFLSFLSLLMLLNVYIGLFNLFPLPALDGGRLVFLVYEMVTRRRANPKIEATVHMVGIMALGVLLIVVTFKDCQRVFF